ncbi:hypothetical protein JAAARDRAFT_193524 [Jaapia argillacea MUCL 33604]|uniref:Uncharacterized protein n=1 Tax=Jaapia argillacea MUCL 33604 TaxID=933084 RepID=A0A067Q618_9AGAM|nr:hypothetical protein JAAARDRAFT_193524 [Jaapia argillacea MUCL 33604]
MPWLFDVAASHGADIWYSPSCRNVEEASSCMGLEESSIHQLKGDKKDLLDVIDDVEWVLHSMITSGVSSDTSKKSPAQGHKCQSDAPDGPTDVDGKGRTVAPKRKRVKRTS